jgi:lipopolysaccharide export system protein LptC
VNLRGVLALLLLAAAAVGTWLLSLRGTEEVPQAADPSTIVSGYYMRDATVTGTAEDGDVLYRLHAAEATQAEDGGPVQLSEVTVRYSPEATVPWSLTAASGVLEPASRKIVLSGNVRAVSEPDDNGEVTELTTARLEFDPRAKTASTEERVTIRIGEQSLSATGMLAFLQEDRVELKSNVSGKFMP